jgi:hypothetical protein
MVSVQSVDKADSKDGAGIPSVAAEQAIRQVIQNISLLLTQRHYRGHDALDEHSSIFALRTEAMFVPDDASTKGMFSSIIDRFDTLPIHERP